MDTLNLFIRTAQEEEQQELDLQTTDTQVEAKKAELRQWFQTEVARNFDEELDKVIRSGAIDVESFLQTPYVVGKAVIQRVASNYSLLHIRYWGSVTKRILNALKQVTTRQES